MPVHSDDELVRGARNLDQRILVEIYDLYSSGLFAYAYRLLGDAEVAEDCVAETYTRLLQVLKNQKGPRENIRAYLYRIAHNWITDIYRNSARQMEESLETGPELQDTTHVEESADLNCQLSKLRSWILDLSPDQRLVITLRFIEGWDLEQVAHAIQKPVGAVKALQHRGLSVLQKKMAQREEINEN